MMRSARIGRTIGAGFVLLAATARSRRLALNVAVLCCVLTVVKMFVSPERGSTGEKLVRRARRARTDPNWLDKTKEQKDLALRTASVDELNERRWREGR